MGLPRLASMVALLTALNLFSINAFSQFLQTAFFQQPNKLELLAGNIGFSGSLDDIGAAARFNNPFGIAFDSSGTLYVVDQLNHTIRKISTTGTVSTLAGSAGLWGSTDGTGSNARFFYPWGITVDTAKNVYVTEPLNNIIRKITPAGVVTTLAGTAGLSGSSDGTGAAARFNYPTGITVDSSGVLFVVDSFNSTIRKITAAGVVTTHAGSPGITGSTDGTTTAARFNSPNDITVDASGNLYVTDCGNYTVRMISAAGIVSTLAGTPGVSGSTDGTGPSASFNSAYVITTDNSNLYVFDFVNVTLRKITFAGVVTTIAGSVSLPGSTDGTGAAARFSNSYGIAVDSSGNIFVSDTGNATIRKVTSAGVVSTFAGTAAIYGSSDGAGISAKFNIPAGTAVDSSGNIFVADSGNSTIRKITAAGTVSTFAGATGINGSTDGTGSAARFTSPSGIAIDGSDNLYVTDVGNFTIRKITPSGVVTTLAGNAGSSGNTNGTGTAARFSYPNAIAIDASGNLYVAEMFDNTIRKITPAGVVTTFAGTAGQSGSTDGTGSAARFSYPSGIGVDGSGNIFVADANNSTIRKITTAGAVSTFAGTAGATGRTNGVGASARFYNPSSLTVDSAGNIYVADTSNNDIRKITANGTVSTQVGGISSGIKLGFLPSSINYANGIFVKNGRIYFSSANAILTFQSP